MDYSAAQRQLFREFVTQTSPGTDPLGVRLLGQVVRMSNQLVNASERQLARTGLTWAKLRLLMHLLRCEKFGKRGVAPSELSDLQSISRNTVSELINSLERDGLIRRELDSSDRRKFLIHLTPKGHKRVRAKLVMQFEFASRCFQGLTAG